MTFVGFDLDHRCFINMCLDSNHIQITNNVYVSCNSRRLRENYHNVKLKILSRNTLLLSLIFQIKIRIMRIIQLSTASSPAHIEWDTLSQFLSPGI